MKKIYTHTKYMIEKENVHTVTSYNKRSRTLRSLFVSWVLPLSYCCTCVWLSWVYMCVCVCCVPIHLPNWNSIAANRIDACNTIFVYTDAQVLFRSIQRHTHIHTRIQQHFKAFCTSSHSYVFVENQINFIRLASTWTLHANTQQLKNTLTHASLLPDYNA